MKKPLGAAPESIFWYWVNERHQMYVKREVEKLPRPWTDDPILQTFRFCNPFRENDKVTVWLRENFLVPNRDLASTDLIAFNIAWFRMFNRITTAEALGFQWDWDPLAVKQVLRGLVKQGVPVFTGVYIVRCENGMNKIDSIVDILSKVWEERRTIADICREGQSLEVAWNRMQHFRMIGPFLAFEMVTDMRHTRLLEDATDILTWANPGPGAIRGLRRIFGISKWHKGAHGAVLEPYLPKKELIPRMQELLARSRENTGAHVPAMDMRDIEHSLCEFDKYCRVKYGEGRPRALYAGGAELGA